MDALSALHGYGGHESSSEDEMSETVAASGTATPLPSARAGATTPTEKHPSPRTAAGAPRAPDAELGGDPAEVEQLHAPSFDDTEADRGDKHEEVDEEETDTAATAPRASDPMSMAQVVTVLKVTLVPATAGNSNFHFTRPTKPAEDALGLSWPLLHEIAARMFGFDTPSVLSFWKQLAAAGFVGNAYRCDSKFCGGKKIARMVRAHRIRASLLTALPPRS